MIIAFGWLAGAFNKKVLFETAQCESLGETKVLMSRQHSNQQKFFDLLGELKFRTIFLVAMGVMYHGHFSFRNERDVRFDCSFLSVGIPAGFLNWLGYQLIFLLILNWLGYQLIFLIRWDTS